MIPYFQGGYDEAKMYTKGSTNKLNFRCPDCNRVKADKTPINYIRRCKSIGCICGDGFSYPEKFIYSMLEQLKEYFTTQLNKSELDWCRGYYYDFYIPNLKCIIETHGSQHYIETGRGKGRRLNEEQKNDNLKKELALVNDIKNYIELDCRKSDVEWIKNSIFNSKLNDLFDLSKVDWIVCEEFALGNLIKDVCNRWNNKEKWETVFNISSNFKISRNTTVNYLKIGNDRKWCSYDPKEEMRKSAMNNRTANYKKVQVFKGDILLGEFESCLKLERESEELFGVRLLSSKISSVATGKKPHYKRYKFKYI